MVANRIWILIGKKVSGEATPQELSELEHLVANSGDSIHTITGLEQMWRTVNIESVHKSDEEIDQRWERFKGKIESDEQVVTITKSNKRSFIWLAAASILIILSVSLSLLTSNRVEGIDDTLITVQAHSGEPKKIKLPDGSTIWLNALSKVTYKKHFINNFREVNLVGEAFFDVTKDANHPFIVNTASLHLKVLGTAFNVRAFANEKKTEAALVHGSIEVTLVNNPDKKITLKPSEKITVRNGVPKADSAYAAIRTINKGNRAPVIPLMTLSNIHYNDEDPLPVETQWIEKKLAFESETLDDIATRMERYYGVKIEFEDESLKSFSFSGTFQTQTVVEAMKSLQETGGFRFKFRVENNNKITIYK